MTLNMRSLTDHMVVCVSCMRVKCEVRGARRKNSGTVKWWSKQ